ncbi:MAG: type II toxin-antitoxin system VapC family toxin [Kyrpidia sp.]|nr:type II toxin-antitoxin system VapC family toxin [Kyrpidia sp.]
MLDTNICIYLIKGRPVTLLERLRQCRLGEVGVSVITVAEMQYGACKSLRPHQNMEALEAFLLPLEIAPFGMEAAVAYGRVRAYLESGGQPIGPLDTLIAAHALALNATLVTDNLKEFQRVPHLSVENWATE